MAQEGVQPKECKMQGMYLFADALLLGCITGLQLPHLSLELTNLESKLYQKAAWRLIEKLSFASY